MSRELELSAQWGAVVSAGPCVLCVVLTLLFPLLLVFHLLAIMFVFCTILFVDFFAVRSWHS